MSTQTIGAAAAGTAVVGGGGALAAYAAGAFSSKVEEKEQERRKGTYRTLVEQDKSMQDKEYIGDKEEEIETLLKNDTSYKNTLRDTYWESMDKKDIFKSLSLVKTDKSQLDLTNRKSEAAKFVSAWCQATSEKELSQIPSEGTTDHKKWEAFKFACFKKNQA
ncbi:hypothetical protein [Candidatus Mycoplasma haematohominis]|uniref:hypothetical protein n=1 Tax=Candidatus Mycoplasma haematohominis TaxID=1494318 RepID=UPI001C0A6A33|nr:hypothetical protein [Candidatus Mycoplasma haemohominis]